MDAGHVEIIINDLEEVRRQFVRTPWEHEVRETIGEAIQALRELSAPRDDLRRLLDGMAESIRYHQDLRGRLVDAGISVPPEPSIEQAILDGRW
jgi:hypothetical protein